MASPAKSLERAAQQRTRQQSSGISAHPPIYNRPMTEADAVRLVARLPAVWSDLWAGRSTPIAFHYSSWAKPHAYFRGAEQLERLAPGLKGLCPLVERNGEAIIGWLPDSGRFVEFQYEDGSQGDAAITTLGDNYQQFLLSLCLELEEAGMRDEWLELAEAAAFEYAAQLAAALDREPFDEGALDALRDRIGPSR
jgi:hypothetical protein